MLNRMLIGNDRASFSFFLTFYHFRFRFRFRLFLSLTIHRVCRASEFNCTSSKCWIQFFGFGVRFSTKTRTNNATRMHCNHDSFHSLVQNPMLNWTKCSEAQNRALNRILRILNATNLSFSFSFFFFSFLSSKYFLAIWSAAHDGLTLNGRWCTTEVFSHYGYLLDEEDVRETTDGVNLVKWEANEKKKCQTRKWN